MPTQKQIEITKVSSSDTHNGKVRWDVMVDGQWDSSWELKRDAKSRVARLPELLKAQSGVSQIDTLETAEALQECDCSDSNYVPACCGYRFGQ